jgi:hypothetical protein
MVGLIIASVILATMVAVFWVRGIDYMKTNHPNYKGEDLFNEEDKNHIL